MSAIYEPCQPGDPCWDDVPPPDEPPWDDELSQRRKAKAVDRHIDRVAQLADDERARRAARRLVDEEEAALTVVEFRSLTAFEFLGVEYPDDQNVIDRFVIEGGNTLVVAPKKVGKTTFGGNLCRSLVEGAPFLGEFDCPAPKRTYLMNLEMPDRMLQSWIADIGIRPEGLHRLVISERLRGRSLPFTSRTVRRDLVKVLADHGIEVWVIDCFRPLIAAAGFDENDNAKISQLLLYVDEIKAEAGCATAIGFHHGTSAGEVEAGWERGRGASAWGDWPDIQVFLTKDKGTRYVRTEGRVDDLPESRLDYSPTSRRLYLASEGESRADSRRSDGMKAIVEAVLAQPGITKNDLLDAISDVVTNATQRKALVGAALKAGSIHYHAGKNRSQHHYVGEMHPGLDPDCEWRGGE